jgi:hypothetical protein
MKRTFVFNITAAFVINDIIKLCPIKAGSGLWITDFLIDMPFVDTSTGVILSVGDNTTPAKWITGSTAGRSSAGAALRPNSTGLVLASLPALYTADNDFILKITTAPTTGATTGQFIGYLEYHNKGSL